MTFYLILFWFPARDKFDLSERSNGAKTWHWRRFFLMLRGVIGKVTTFAVLMPQDSQGTLTSGIMANRASVAQPPAVIEMN